MLLIVRTKFVQKLAKVEHFNSHLHYQKERRFFSYSLGQISLKLKQS